MHEERVAAASGESDKGLILVHFGDLAVASAMAGSRTTPRDYRHCCPTPGVSFAVQQRGIDVAP